MESLELMTVALCDRNVALAMRLESEELIKLFRYAEYRDKITETINASIEASKNTR